VLAGGEEIMRRAIRKAESSGNPAENGQISVSYNGRLEPGETLVWEIEALGGPTDPDDLPSYFSNTTNRPYAYGGVKGVTYRVSDLGVSPNTINAEAVQGTGIFQSPWVGDRTTYTAISFDPDPPAHYPSAYRQSEPFPRTDRNGNPVLDANGQQVIDYANGTRHKNVCRHNPQLGYKVTARLYRPLQFMPVTLPEAIIQMDEVDVLRQEYINHIQSAPESAVVGGRDVDRVVTVPARSALKALSDMPDGDWVDTGTNGYQYSYLLSDGMEQMWTDFQTAWNATSKTITLLNSSSTTTMPTGDDIRVSSSYRNPERQEYYGNATKSLHMMGRALDIAATGVPSLGTSANPTPSFDRGVVFHIVTNAMENNSIAAPYWDMWQLEDIDIATVKNGSGFIDDADGLDNSGSGIADGYERTGHLHLQDDPTKGNHR